MTSIVLSETISRDCIECDGPGCLHVCPEKKCSRCHTAFYCSVECQKNHWKAEHKSYCIPIQDMKDKQTKHRQAAETTHQSSAAERTQEEEVPLGIDKALNTECPVCFADPVETPIVLKGCRHAFCSSCLIQWQQRSSSSLDELLFPQNQRNENQQKCPLCRTHADDVIVSIAETARLYGSRAAREGCPKAEQLQYRQAAIEQLDKVITGDSDTYKTDLAIFFMKAELLIAMKRGKEALECLDQLKRVNDARREQGRPMWELIQQAEAAVARADPRAEELMQAVVDMYEEERPPDSGDVMLPGSKLELAAKLFRADAHQILEEWNEAIAIYVEIIQNMDDPDQATPVQMREIWMGLAHCSYEAGHYDRSIKATQAALDYNRHFPGVHKYKALSEKALGEMEDAVTTMQRALIYETPWDEEHQQTVLNLYHDMLELRDVA